MNNERKKNEENAATNELLSNMEDITTMKNAAEDSDGAMTKIGENCGR